MEPNRAALEQFLDRLTSSDALLAPPPLVELARTLADDMDAAEAHPCPKCKHPISFGHNAALVKQYRDLVEAIAGDTDRASPFDTVLAEIRDKASRGTSEPR